MLGKNILICYKTLRWATKCNVMKKMSNMFFYLLILVTVGLINVRVSTVKYFEFLLDDLTKIALAESECGAQESQYGVPQTGQLCTCDGQLIYPQKCFPPFSGTCSPIECD
jgi:hypothetical protein